MADTFLVNTSTSKKEQYENALLQLEALTEGESDWIANVSNIMACLKYGFGFFWVGVYLVKDGELVLGPFQGPLACTRIAKGKGVCGNSWELKETLLVPDVEAFPGHIACSSDSKSEVVVPLFDNNQEVIGVLDVDSDKLNDFDQDDQNGLEQIGKLLSKMITSKN